MSKKCINRQIAIKLGLKRYKGKVCPNHPDAERYVSNRSCTVCDLDRKNGKPVKSTYTKKVRKKKNPKQQPQTTKIFNPIQVPDW